MQLSGRLRAESGFTSMEILVVAGISLVAVSAFAAFNRVQLFSLRNQAAQSDLQVTARNIVDLFSREVRQAGANPACVPGLSAIADAKQNLLRIQSDLDGDGAVTGPNETITYQYKFSSNVFERVSSNSTDSLIDGVSLAGSRIRYFDQAGVEVTAGSTGLSSAQRDNVRRIRIELTIEAPSADPYDVEPLRVAVANDVDVRNRYFANAVTCP